MSYCSTTQYFKLGVELQSKHHVENIMGRHVKN